MACVCLDIGIAGLAIQLNSFLGFCWVLRMSELPSDESFRLLVLDPDVKVGLIFFVLLHQAAQEFQRLCRVN